MLPLNLLYDMEYFVTTLKAVVRFLVGLQLLLKKNFIAKKIKIKKMLNITFERLEVILIVGITIYVEKQPCMITIITEGNRR